MKYLYRILRLFFCPHSYKIIRNGDLSRRSDGSIVGHFYDLQCKHCGKITYKENIV